MFRFPMRPACRRARKHLHLVQAAEVFEDRLLLAATSLAPTATAPSNVRSIDGTGNNLSPGRTTWGSAGTDLLRIAAAAYADGIDDVGGTSRPGARQISNTISNQGSQDIINNRGLSAMIYAWGQFIDHDLDLTPTGTDPLSIPVPKGDPQFDPGRTGQATIDTHRSIFDPATGTSRRNPRQQVSVITAWLDGSMIYGSDSATAASLRTTGGKLLTSAGNMLPVDSNGFYLAGDTRANENIELTSLQTLFVREHNCWATRIAQQSSTPLTDDQIYQQARAIVIGEIQSITYNQWLPALLGPNAMPGYFGYNANVNPGIANEFSTAGFRLGHSLLGDDIEFLDNNGLPIADEVSLHDAFFNPSLVAQNGIDPLLKYLSSDPASELDTKIVDSVRNFLFVGPGQGGFDLASLNIERGRDNGIADYNSVRAAYGLPRVTTFAQITSDRTVQAQLQQLYGNVNNIDLWVGALAENHVPGGSVGVTLRAIITDQFRRTRDADRFWYQRTFSGTMLEQLNQTTLADIIKRNTSVNNLQGNVFFFQASLSGTVQMNVTGFRGRQTTVGVPGRTVELIDSESGGVLATKVTDLWGRYKFTVADGVRTGNYQVHVLADRNGQGESWSQLMPITRGDQNYTININISLSSVNRLLDQATTVPGGLLDG